VVFVFADWGDVEGSINTFFPLATHRHGYLSKEFILPILQHEVMGELPAQDSLIWYLK
jgi:hypothetical protein